MNKQVIQCFEENKDKIKQELQGVDFISYRDIVQAVMRQVDFIDSDNLREIDDGDYQGTLLYIAPKKEYQPETYYYVFVGYGSCSVCDMLESIRCHVEEEKQIDDYMKLALDIATGIKEIRAY